MDINNSYKLLTNNYVNIESIKKQIVIGNTNNHNMKHYIGKEFVRIINVH